MINPECLDPREVLAHLNAMGYYDITSQQLKDFIHDLTKLIKYEQKLAAQASSPCFDVKLAVLPESSESPESTESPELPQPTESPESLFTECLCCPPHNSENVDQTPEESYYESSIESSSTSATYTASNIKHSPRNHVESENTQRYHTSFIRSWNLQGCKDLSRGKKNLDPVRLYHQYKEYWKRQSIPGENKHLDLRWDIRNRMVSQEPSPRVCI